MADADPQRLRNTARENDPAPGSSPADPPANAAEPTLDGAFAPDGVDLTLIRWMLDRSPAERLQAAQQLLDTAWALRGDEA